ncbi:MAG: ATP synthase F1 subunit epsilon [Bacteroidetes bacterium]|nr:ATP synthase F1 subunit epsilon [Bacteroidota bacterium]
MANLFELEIITPQRKEYTGSVQSVSCPGESGRFQILYNHAPFLATLAVGLAKVIDAEGNTIQYAISGGSAQVFHNQMRVLANAAERSDSIDVARAEAAKRRAEERLKSHTEDIDSERVRLALLRAINRLKVAGEG